MTNKDREMQLNSIIKDYNIYCKNNIDNFLSINTNFQQQILKIEECIKNGDNYNAGKLTEGLFTDEFIWGIIFADLSKLDLSKVPIEHLIRIPFSTFTKWPSAEKLPKGFNPNDLIQKSKNKKNSKLEKLHNAKITGKGIKIAYLDSPFDTEHERFNNLNVEYNPMGNQDLHFHGYAVADRLLNIAPDCSLIYFGCGDDDEYKGSGSQTISKIKALRNILNRVENGENIVAVGMSSTLEETIENIKDLALKEKAQRSLIKIKSRLQELGVEYLDSPNIMTHFNYACKRNPLLEDEDIDNYIPHCKLNYQKEVHILEADRVRPLPCSVNGYIYENNLGCASWMIPQIVGYYALTKQINKELTFNEFCKIAKQTSIKNNNNMLVLNSIELIKEIKFRKENNINI